MTIGKNSNKKKAPRAPPFLDRASGFYGRLDEIESEFGKEVQITKKQPAAKPATGELISGELPDDQEHCVPDFGEGMMEDDGTALLKRKPSRLSRRWSRKSSRKNKPEKSSLEMDVQNTGSKMENPNLNVCVETQAQTGLGNTAPEPMLIHFSIREEADDQKLIPEGKERQLETGDKRGEGKVERKSDLENKKVVKRSSLRTYRKVLDKALRRGWDNLVANLYSVTLSQGSSSVSSDMDMKAALADFR